MVSFGFFGSSQNTIAEKYGALVDGLLHKIFSDHSEIRIITGGYDGLMRMVSQRAREIQEKNYPNCYLEVYGVLYSGFEEDANDYLDRSITALDIGERVNSLIELSDFLFGLPGSNGTLHEILHAEEILKYPSEESGHLDVSGLFVHDFWKERIELKKAQLFSDPNGLILKKAKRQDQQKDKEELILKPQITDRITEIIGKGKNISNLILGFDFAFTLFSEEFGLNQGVSQSISTNSYGKVLGMFLEKHPSILNFDKQIRDYRKISCRLNANTESLEESKRPISTKILNEAYSPEEAFETWNNHLEEQQFGKLSFCVSEPLQFDQITVNVSCFLVLNIDLPKWKCEQILSLLKSHILGKGLSSILEEVRPYLRTTAELQTYREYTAVHQHVIKNMQFKRSLLRLEKHHLDGSELAKELIDGVKCMVELRDISTQLFYSYGETISSEIFKSYDVKTLAKLLELIYRSGYRANKGFEIFSIDDTALYCLQNNIPEEDFLNIFNLVYNLYSNTRKHSNDEQYTVKLTSVNQEYLELFFITKSELPKYYLDFLNGDLSIDINEHRGFRHIKDSILRLNRWNIQAIVENGITAIKIKIT